VDKILLLANFSYSAPKAIMNRVCALGVAWLISLVAFLILGMVCRKVLDRRREECRRIVARLLESRLGNLHSLSWRGGSVRPGSGDMAQAPGGDNGSPAGMESVRQI
jgi:hypothetical protein